MRNQSCAFLCHSLRVRVRQRHLRVDLEGKVFLLAQLRDGLQHVAHGQHSAAVRPAVLHVGGAFPAVVEQHATCGGRG